MRAPIHHVPRRRAAARLLLTCALVMALCTLAGGRAGVDVPGAVAPAPAQAGGTPRPRVAAAPVASAATSPSATAATGRPPSIAEAPPFAPGGDDVKNWDDPAHPSAPATTGTHSLQPRPAQPRAQPVPVLGTSWHNRQLAAALPLPDSSADRPTTAGDFFQEGQLALFAVVAAADGSMAAAFLARVDAGLWVDRSAELLANAGDRRLCASPRQALTADLNRDGRPDVYVVCRDASHVAFVSHPDGGYRKLDTGFSAWATHAEAADVDGDGDIDVFTVEAARAHVLWGRGDGSFDDRAR